MRDEAQGKVTVPCGWAIATAEEVCEKIQDGTHFSPKNQSRIGPFPYITAKNVRPTGLDLDDLTFLEEEEHRPIYDRCDARRGDVLLVKDGVNTGDAAINTIDGEISLLSSVAMLRPRQGIVLSGYLRYFLQSPQGNTLLTGRMSGTAIRRIILRRIRKTPVLVPPFQQQHRIVAALDSYLTRLDAAEAALKRVQANLRRYRASVLKAAVEGRLVPTEAELARQEGRDYEPASALLQRILAERRRRWEEAELAKMKAKGKTPKDDRWKAKYKEPAPPDTAELPDLPEGWCWALLPQLGELSRGKSKHRPRNDPKLLGGSYPFIQTGDVRRADGFIERFEDSYSDLGLAQSRLWPAGTLCITIAANIAETGILKFDSCFPDSVVGLLNPDYPELIRYIEIFIRTARKNLERYAPATAQKNINLATLSEVAVPLPPISEQRRILSEVDRLLTVSRHVEEAEAAGEQRIARLRQSILKWAFEGKLVDQDPDDEPAAVLLQRIKSRRQTSPTTSRRRRRKRSPAEAQGELFTR